MDSMEQEKRQAMAEFRRARRRASVSVVLLVLLVGLLVSLSSWDQDLSLLLTGLPDCFWVDRRKAMFLLCNLILAVIAMDSGMLASFTPEEERCGEFPVREKSHRSREEARRSSAVGNSRWPLPVAAVEKGGKLAAAAAAAAVAEEQEQEQEEQQQQQQQQQQQLRKEQRQQQQQQEQEQEEEGVGEDGCPDMDELNKKFEDFIEKVKMERKLEALQLVRV